MEIHPRQIKIYSPHEHPKTTDPFIAIYQLNDIYILEDSTTFNVWDIRFFETLESAETVVKELCDKYHWNVVHQILTPRKI